MFQQQLLECDTIPTTSPVQDTSSHMISHDSFQQPLENNMYSNEEMLQPISLSQLEMETKESIANFNTQLFANSYQQWSNSPDDPPPPPISPSVCCSYIHAVQKH